MLQRPAFENHYCHRCRETHKHEARGLTFQCQRCGTLAHTLSARRNQGPASLVNGGNHANQALNANAIL